MNTASEKDNLNQVLLELVQAHGFQVELRDGQVVVEGQLFCSVELFGEWPMADGRVSVQLDFFIRFAKEGERSIKQSLAGWGSDTQKAVTLAFDNFNRSTLHIVLGAFFPQREHHISKESWHMDEKKWNVFFDSIVYLCGDPQTQQQLYALPLFATLQSCIEKNFYSEKINWVSFFVSGNVIEILLNNTPWKEAQEVFAKLSWPQTGQYFSARTFLIFTEE